MKKDKHKTKVVFLLETGNGTDNETPFAFFPEEHYLPVRSQDHSVVFTCYAHVGQHSACHIEYAQSCKLASPEQYKDLAAEMESLGYNLEILKSHYENNTRN